MKSPTAASRRYVLTKISKGDYLLPSNDGGTIWRLRTYEDGPSHGLDWPKDQTFWGVWRWTGALPYFDIEDWDRWQMAEGFCNTRAEAISAALRLSAGGETDDR